MGILSQYISHYTNFAAICKGKISLSFDNKNGGVLPLLFQFFAFSWIIAIISHCSSSSPV